MNIKMLTISTVLLVSSALQTTHAAADQHTQSQVYTPEGILADGEISTISKNPYTLEEGPARKGTVAATLNNIALLNHLLLKSASKEEVEQIHKITAAADALIPSLRVISVFDLFTVEEWMNSADQPGRVWVVVLYLKKYPAEITPSRRATLEHIAKTTPVKLLAQEINTALKVAL